MEKYLNENYYFIIKTRLNNFFIFIRSLFWPKENERNKSRKSLSSTKEKKKVFLQI